MTTQYADEVKDTVARIKSGELIRDADEKYAEGFWDLAGSIADDYLPNNVGAGKVEELQEKIYNVFWAIVETK